MSTSSSNVHVLILAIEHGTAAVAPAIVALRGEFRGRNLSICEYQKVMGGGRKVFGEISFLLYIPTGYVTRLAI